MERSAYDDDEYLIARDESFRLFVNLRRNFASRETYKKLVILVAPSMTIKQLKQKIEMEFAEIFPREEPYFVGKIDDASGYTLPTDSLVGDHFKQGDSIIVWPRADYEDFPHTYQKENADDLVHTLKNVHYSLISKLSDSYIQEYTDKAELLNTILPLGLSEDVPTIQNICVILNKVLTRDVVALLDDENNSSLLELAVLVMQHWINKIIEDDKFIMNNALMILEMFTKSWSFCSNFKNRTCVEKLVKLSKEPLLPSSTKTQILRIASSLTSSISLDSLRYYTLAKFDNSQGGSRVNEDLNKLHRSIKETYPLSLRKTSIRDNASITERNFLSPLAKKKLIGDLMDGPGHSFANSKTLRTSYSKADLDDLRKEGERRVYYSRVPTPRQAISKILRHDLEDMNNRKLREIADKESFFANPYKVSYFKDAYPLLEKLPPIKFHYSDELLNDYCMMLHPGINNRDVIGFAIHNIDRMLPNAVKDIMSSSERFLAIFRLFEYYNFPKDVRAAQLRIMESICKNMNQERAQDSIENDCLMRVVRAYKFHHPSFRNTLVEFLYAVIDKAGSDYLDLSKLVSLTLCEYPAVQECGMKAICMMSTPEEIDKYGLRYEKDKIDVAFHIHIPYLIESGKSITHSTDYKNYALQTLANLCQRAYLKPYVLYNDGIGCFLEALRNEHNLAGRRIAAKALAQLVEKDEKLRVRIISELSEEVKQTWIHEVDSVIGTYIRRILRCES